MSEIADDTVTLLKHHEHHPEVSNRCLGELFGITKQRVGQIVRRDERDQMVVDYLRTHPEASPAEAARMFHITKRRLRSLVQNRKRDNGKPRRTSELGRV